MKSLFPMGIGKLPATFENGTCRSVMSLLLLALALLINTSLNAAEPVLIDTAGTYKLSKVSYVFEKSDLTWQQVAGLDLNEYTANNDFRLRLGSESLPAWVRVDVTTGSIPLEEWLFDTDTSFGGRMNFYHVVEGQLIKHHEVDTYKSFYNRPYNHRRIKFPIELEPNKTHNLILHIESSTRIRYDLNLTPTSQFTSGDIKQTLFLGLHFGIILSLMAYHLLLAAATLDRNYFIYSIYLASYALISINSSGFGFQFLWPNYPEFQFKGSAFWGFLPNTLAIVFTVSFLELYRLSRTITVIFLLAAAFGIINNALRSFGLIPSFSATTYLTTAVYLSFIPAAIYSMHKGVVHARYYLVAWTLYNLAFSNYTLSAMGIYLFFPEHVFLLHQLGFELQTMLLALALAHRIRVLRNEKMEAQSDNRAKSAFLARMSHEIRTPLSGILGMSELLADRLKDKTDIYYNNIIRSAGTSLLTIINDILDYSKFTSDNMELEKVPFSIHRLAVDSLDVFKVKAAEKHIELIADVDLDVSDYVKGDPTRVKQILLNFISNAIKFTEKGQIVVSIDFVPDHPDMLKISTTDTGVGIDKNEQSRLFEAFSQANSATTRKYGGTGLGLSICRQLALLMGGDIGVQSVPGEGSTFWFTAMLPASTVEVDEHVEEVSLKGLRVLIVEDNYTFANLLEVQTKTWGMEPVIALNGRQALEKLNALVEAGLKVDFISLDLFMPIMDGMEFSRKIQEDKRFSNIPRLLLTSAINFPPKHQLEAAGINKVVEKPTLPADLLKIYKQLLAPDTSTVNKPQEQVKDKKSEIKRIDILVVEDNKVNQTVVQGILKRMNQNPEVTDDGEDAVELITTQGKKYDLIFMDCEMPKMDGITATRKIREWEKQKNITPTTIVALTAHAVQAQMHACYEAGMDAYLTKPIEIAKLENLVRRCAQNEQLESFAIPPMAASGN